MVSLLFAEVEKMFKIIRGYYDALRTKIRYWLCGCYQKNNPESFLLMFHDVNPGETDTRKFVSNIDEYCSYLSHLNQTKKACSTKEILEEKGVNRFAVTFDDAFMSVYQYVYPFMKEKGIPFTVFMTTDFIDKPGYLSLERLRELDADPLCTIGAHCVSHPLLRQCQNAEEEISESKRRLEELLGHEIAYLAYPYGSYFACANRNKRQAEKAGFTCAFSAIDGYMNGWARKQKFFLPRYNGDPLVQKYMKEVN